MSDRRLRRYLLVDDNQAFAENLAEILRDEGADVDVAAGGQAALALAGASRYDALVTDMRMPVMNGAALVHEIRRRDPGLPAIVVTAYTGENDLEAARQEGLLAVLPKPVPIPRLVELLGVAKRDGLVALIEDDPAMSDNLGEALRDRGYSAVTARSVIETQRLGPVRPFAGLVDLRVQGGPDGEAMRTLERKYQGLPIVLVTAYADLARDAHAAAVFSKPFDTGELLSALDRLHAGAV